MKEIDLKKIYYYNNRPVKIIQKAWNNMCLVCANTSGITTTLKSMNFCSACQFEQKANDELLKQISKMKVEKQELIKTLLFLESKKLTLNNETEKASKELNNFLDRITNRTKDLHELEEKITEYSADLKDVKIVSDMGISIKITPEKYEELLTSQNRLCALEAGGVDNWEWYDESLGDSDHQENAKAEIMEEFKNELLK